MTLEESQAHAELHNNINETNGDATYMNKRIERRYDILTSAAMIIALSSLMTAGASVYMLIDSNHRSQENTASIIAALKNQPISVPGTAGATNQSQGQATASAVPSESAAAGAQQQGGSAGAQQRSGGSASAGQQGGGGAGAQQRSGGSASAGQQGGGGASAGQQGGGGAGAQQQGGGGGAAPQQQAQPQGAAQPAPQEVAQPAAPAVTAPVPSPELLLQITMAAAEPGVPGDQLATKAVDGPAAAPTLERVADVRSRMAPPPGMEHMGDVVNFQIRDVVVNNDTATATLIIVWPAGWGEWTYPESGYQYVDGEWKLQKSTVCNLAAAAWVDCY